MKEKGKFIVFEGLDGAGTTTQMKILCEKFRKKNKSVFMTNEPTDNPIGKLVRSILQKKVSTTAYALALLYSADRDDHLYNSEYGITGHLENGETVISDRYFYSSYAYQSVELEKDEIRKLNSRFPDPDCVIFIDTSVSDSIDRIERRGEEKELFEREEYLSLVRSNYLSVFSSLPEGVALIRVDGSASIDEISREIEEKLMSLSLL